MTEQNPGVTLLKISLAIEVGILDSLYNNAIEYGFQHLYFQLRKDAYKIRSRIDVLAKLSNFDASIEPFEDSIAELQNDINFLQRKIAIASVDINTTMNKHFPPRTYEIPFRHRAKRLMMALSAQHVILESFKADITTSWLKSKFTELEQVVHTFMTRINEQVALADDNANKTIYNILKDEIEDDLAKNVYALQREVAEHIRIHQPKRPRRNSVSLNHIGEQCGVWDSVVDAVAPLFGTPRCNDMDDFFRVNDS